MKLIEKSLRITLIENLLEQFLMEHNKILRGFFFWKIIQLTPKRISEVNSEAHFEKVRRKDSSEISVIIFFSERTHEIGCDRNALH